MNASVSILISLCLRLRYNFFPQGTGRHSSICAKGKLESKAISVVGMSHVAPPEQSAVLETTEQPPRRQFTMNEIVKYQDFKLSSGVICINAVFTDMIRSV